MTEPMQGWNLWWNPECKKLLDDACAIWQDVSPKIKQTGHWIIHPTTFETLAPLSSHEFDTTVGTLFGRPIYTSPHVLIGTFYFETEQEIHHPPVYMWSDAIITVAQSNFSPMDIAGITPVPLSVPLWSETPEPDWLVTMAIEMAEVRE